MNRSEYLETEEGQRSTRRKRFLRRQRFAVQNHEPKSKNAISQAEKIDFQRAIDAQLRQNRRRTYSSRVVLEMDFYSQQNDPPAIHTLAKNYMDLLQKPVEGSGINRKYLVLPDDRLIDVLIVNYHLREQNQPEVQFEVGTVADFVQDLALLERIRHQDFHGNVDYDPDDVWEGGEFDDAHRRLDEAINNLHSWQQSRTDIEASLGHAAFDGMDRSNTLQVQELYLKVFEPKVEDLLFLLAPLIHGGEPGFNALHAQMRDMIVTPPFMLDMTHAPIEGVGKDVFKTNVDTALADFTTKHEILFPLLTTVGVTILCVPPESHAAEGTETYVDLDNLARYIIPAVHEVLKPPSNTVYTFDVSAITNEQLRRNFEERLTLLKRTPKHSVSQYQMVRLPRLPSDHEAGIVRLALCNGRTYQGLWRRMDKIIRRWQG